MEQQQSELILWVLSGYGLALTYIILEQIKSSKQVNALTTDMAVLKNVVSELSMDMRLFLKTEIDTLKSMAERIRE